MFPELTYHLRLYKTTRLYYKCNRYSVIIVQGYSVYGVETRTKRDLVWNCSSHTYQDTCYKKICYRKTSRINCLNQPRSVRTASCTVRPRLAPPQSSLQVAGAREHSQNVKLSKYVDLGYFPLSGLGAKFLRLSLSAANVPRTPDVGESHLFRSSQRPLPKLGGP